MITISLIKVNRTSLNRDKDGARASESLARFTSRMIVETIHESLVHSYLSEIDLEFRDVETVVQFGIYQRSQQSEFDFKPQATQDVAGGQVFKERSSKDNFEI